MITKKSLSKSSLKTFTLIIYILLVFLNSCKSDNKVKEVINDKKIAFQCDEINIPIFQPAQEVSESCIEDRLMKILIFKSNITYPSKEIFHFYESYLKKNGFETASLKKLNYDDRKWIKGYSESKGKRKYSAQFTAFWVNRKKNQIWWLDINSDLPDTKIMKKKKVYNVKQYTVIIAKIFDPMLPLDEINVSHYYPELSDNELGKNEEEKKINHNQLSLEGYYTLGEVKLDFRIVTTSLPKENISKKLEKRYDLNGKMYVASKKIEISEKDIHHLMVKKSDFYNSLNIEFTFKNEFINQYQKNGIKLKGKWVGLFKGDKLILVAYFHESIEKVMILNFEDLSKLKIIIEGMIKKKE